MVGETEMKGMSGVGCRREKEQTLTRGIGGSHLELRDGEPWRVGNWLGGMLVDWG